MNFRALLESFRGKRVCVLGDLMVDEYLFGSATRISPEAPVMVVRHAKTERLPGGAANVARNINALGGKVHLVGVCGTDEGAERLRQCLNEQRIQSTLFEDPSRATTRKVRILADGAHQTLRVDFEDTHPIPATLATQLAEAVQADADVIILSDYTKGVLLPNLVADIIAAHPGKVVANVKPETISHYKGAALASLNRVETEKAVGHTIDRSSASFAGSTLRTDHEIGTVLITLGADGMVAVGPDGPIETNAVPVSVFDPAGAGDTVIATVALGLCSVGPTPEVFALAAQTAACVVRRVGVATPTEEDFAMISSLENRRPTTR